MKGCAVFLLTAFFIIVSCEYQAPLIEEHSIPIDSSVLGLWEEVPRAKRPNPDERMLILKYSDTEYLILYPTQKDGLYYRGYPIDVGGIPCVQIQLIGSADGEDIKKEERGFQVISYKLSNGELEIRTLNTNLVAKNLKDSASLRQVFLKHKDNKELFSNPGKFRKIKEKN
jgi:hypothetical protein